MASVINKINDLSLLLESFLVHNLKFIEYRTTVWQRQLMMYLFRCLIVGRMNNKISLKNHVDMLLSKVYSTLKLLYSNKQFFNKIT